MSKRFRSKSTAAASVTRSGRKYKPNEIKQRFGGDAENNDEEAAERLSAQMSGMKFESFMNDVATIEQLRDALEALKFPFYQASRYDDKRIVAYSQGAPDPPPDESEILIINRMTSVLSLNVSITRGGYWIGTKISSIGRSIMTNSKLVDGVYKYVPNQKFWFVGPDEKDVDDISAAEVLKLILQIHPNLLWLADADEKRRVMNQIGLETKYQKRVLEGNIAYTTEEIEPWNIRQQMKRRVHPKEIGQDWIPSSELRHLQSKKLMRKSRSKVVESRRQL